MSKDANTRRGKAGEAERAENRFSVSHSTSKTLQFQTLTIQDVSKLLEVVELNLQFQGDLLVHLARILEDIQTYLVAGRGVQTVTAPPDNRNDGFAEDGDVVTAMAASSELGRPGNEAIADNRQLKRPIAFDTSPGVQLPFDFNRELELEV